MENHSLFNINNNDFIQSIFHQGKNDPGEPGRISPSIDPGGSFIYPAFLELAQRIEQSMESIKQVTRLSRGKFSDRTLGDHFYQVIQDETEKVDLLLACFQNYIRISYPVQKRDTVHRLLEEALKKQKETMEGKKIRVLKKFEEGLPEIVAPDEHLRYIWESLLQYALAIIPPNGGIGFATRSMLIQKESKEESIPVIDEGKYVEILILFDGYRKTGGPVGTGLQGSFPKKKEGLDLELRLIEEMVTRNRGRMKFEIDEKKRRTSISVRFPRERRKGLH